MWLSTCLSKGYFGRFGVGLRHALDSPRVLPHFTLTGGAHLSILMKLWRLKVWPTSRCFLLVWSGFLHVYVSFTSYPMAPMLVAHVVYDFFGATVAGC